MKRTAVHTMMFASIVGWIGRLPIGTALGMVEAWEQRPTETAVAANSAAPTVALGTANAASGCRRGLQPAASPSATNLAATGSTLATTPLGVQPASPSTIANAPLATYPTTGAPPISDVPPSNVASTHAGRAGSIPPLSTTPTHPVWPRRSQRRRWPTCRPQDRTIRTATSLARHWQHRSQAAPPPATADRYGSYATAAAAPSIPPVSTPATTPIASAAPVDRYAMPPRVRPRSPAQRARRSLCEYCSPRRQAPSMRRSVRRQ